MTSEYDRIPEEIFVNGLNGTRGGYDLRIRRETLAEIAVRADPKLKRKGKLYKGLVKRKVQSEQVDYALSARLDQNNIMEAGWGVIFPAQSSQPLERVREALAVLLDHRKDEAGELYLECFGSEKGYHANETTEHFMQRYKSSPGVVTPKPGRLPYYLLIVGSPQEIPFRFQYELDATFLVGRIYFDTVDEYYQYARSVVESEKHPQQLKRRLALFGPCHPGDRATESSAKNLIIPLRDELAASFKEKKPYEQWQIDALAPENCTRDRLEELLGKKDAPALLFTASHGMVYDYNDKHQKEWQGALVCQDLPSVKMKPGPEHFVAGEHITSDFKLNGLVAFHFACFGAGTPRVDNFAEPNHKPGRLAANDFISALPRRLLSHSQGGALGVIGHVERAWPTSFMWGAAGAQPDTFIDTLYRIMDGETLGNALDNFNVRYAQIAVDLTNMQDRSQTVTPDPFDLIDKWLANNDARGYALLGDPAARLSLAKEGAKAQERKALAVEVFKSKLAGGDGGHAAGEGQRATEKEKTVEEGSEASKEIKVAEGAEPGGVGMGIHYHNAAGVVINNYYGNGVMTPGPAGTRESPYSYGFPLFGGGKAEDEEKKPGPLDEVIEKLSKFASQVCDSLKAFADDASSLEVNTYVSSDLQGVTVKNGKFATEGSLQVRARTLIGLDGDTEVILPSKAAGDLSQQAIWEIHKEVVQQAIQARAETFRALKEMIVGLVRGG